MTLTPLRAGDQIALIAPASPFEVENYTRLRDSLKGKGFQLVQGENVFLRRGYLAGTEADRANDLIEAVKNPSIAAIICVRGGYGSGRLLPWLPFPVLQRNRKIFLGYSDITFLHLAFLSQMGWITFHGPNLLDADSSPGKLDGILQALEGQSGFAWSLQDGHIVRAGVATGSLFGGNLTCISHLLGTPYFPDPKGALLLVEDCSEALYRLDRIFNHLKLAGVLDVISGLILGDFKDCAESREILNMVLEHAGPFHFPIIAGLPFGHDGLNEVIPFGAPFYLNTYERTFRVQHSPFSE
ncbi:MAG: LD-carboxypeptidase [Desulforhabdus sp.]|jgi:muramoyltetrapeptide carboxypeptidase|nr:LD-carboxypeptidase [Desulforhabdus sp.]